jgi:hypothetical protein
VTEAVPWPFEFYMNGTEGNHEIRITPHSLTGKTPADVHPALTMSADLEDGAGIVLAVRGGPQVTCVWDVDNAALAANARWHLTLVEALQQISGTPCSVSPSRTSTR